MAKGLPLLLVPPAALGKHVRTCKKCPGKCFRCMWVKHGRGWRAKCIMPDSKTTWLTVGRTEDPDSRGKYRSGFGCVVCHSFARRTTSQLQVFLTSPSDWTPIPRTLRGMPRQNCTSRRSSVIFPQSLGQVRALRATPLFFCLKRRLPSAYPIWGKEEVHPSPPQVLQCASWAFRWHCDLPHRPKEARSQLSLRLGHVVVVLPGQSWSKHGSAQVGSDQVAFMRWPAKMTDYDKYSEDESWYAITADCKDTWPVKIIMRSVKNGRPRLVVTGDGAHQALQYLFERSRMAELLAELPWHQTPVPVMAAIADGSIYRLIC